MSLRATVGSAAILMVLPPKMRKKKEVINIGKALDITEGQVWTDVSSISNFAGLSEEATKKSLDENFGKYIEFGKDRSIVKVK